MRTGRYELVLIWSTGDKDIYEYESREDAYAAAENMIVANGTQISWWCVREQLN